jgi:hypothetical protein
MYIARGKEDNGAVAYRLIGHVRDKRTGNCRVFGRRFEEEALSKEPFLPHQSIPCYQRRFGVHVRRLVVGGLVPVDYRDCWPAAEFRELNPSTYAILSWLPPYAVYVPRKMS